MSKTLPSYNPSYTSSTAMIYPGESFDPKTVLQAVHQEKATALYGVPTMFIAELAAPEFDSYDLSSLRTGIMAGSICPAEVMKKVNGKMNMKEVQITYGMTETSPVSTQTSSLDPFEKQVTTVGRTQPHLETKIVDPGTGIPDEKYGEELIAWVKLRPDTDPVTGEDLQAFCKGKIAHFKIPKNYKFVDAFPMTVTGKIQKFKMREISIEEMGLKK
ncbi:hypothetical protein BEE62_13465 [Marinobacter nauticus]|uniref:AMP-dependent synthetase/ligase domain-containing protein n=1 Tax=Marinobacter nauticus TaxID=2743 RepID=A0A1M2V068_MARNT|nr:hypothetical protein BEE62_13465 [Marinobacter nauticus]